jgi:adenosylhomocysteine nucleosidase
MVSMVPVPGYIVLDFFQWLCDERSEITALRPLSLDEQLRLAHNFDEQRGRPFDNVEWQETFGKLLGGAQPEDYPQPHDEADPFVRYRKVPLHAILLYSTPDRAVTKYLDDHWRSLDRQTRDSCDLHPSLKQFVDGEDAYTVLAEMHLPRNTTCPGESKLPGIYFWSIQGDFEYIPFGRAPDENGITNVLRHVFERAHVAPTIDSVRAAARHLQRSVTPPLPESPVDTRLGHTESETSRAGGKRKVNPTNTVDVAILIPLEEEFKQLFPRIAQEHTTEEDDRTGRSFYLFQSPGNAGTAYNCVTAFIGGMGTKPAGKLAGKLLERYSPRSVVLLGIAGSLSKDVKVGDVVAADQVEDYLANARVNPDGSKGFEFQLSGQVYRPHVRLNNKLANLRYRHASTYSRLSSEAASDLKGEIGNLAETMVRNNLISAEFAVTVGPIASGDLVGAASAFGEWLLTTRNRKFAALEMEAAGVMHEVYAEAGEERVMILRGISDFSDERKVEFDRIGAGSLRGWAMRNAVRVLFGLMEAGAFESGGSVSHPR